MTLLHALLLGIVEGITEFLPISSTGHLILTAHALGVPETAFAKSFEIAIQFGAILAALALYWRTLLLNKVVLAKTLLAFLPTGVAGLTFYKAVKGLLGSQEVVLWSLIAGGLVLIILETAHKPAHPPANHSVEDITWLQAFVIGCCQIISMIPGISRSAATIVPGVLMGLSRKTVIEFSFLLAVPTMAAATGYDLMKSAGEFSAANLGVLAVGFVVSFFMALLAIKALLGFVRRHTFVSFGVYRIVLAVLFWLFVL